MRAALLTSALSPRATGDHRRSVNSLGTRGEGESQGDANEDTSTVFGNWAWPASAMLPGDAC